MRKSGFYSQKLHGLCKAPEEDPGTAGPAASRCCGDWADLGSQSSPQHPTPARLHLFITCTYLLPASQVGRGTTASHLLPLQGSGLPRAGPRPASASCRRLSAPPPPPRVIKGGRGESASPAEGERLPGSGEWTAALAGRLLRGRGALRRSAPPAATFPSERGGERRRERRAPGPAPRRRRGGRARARPPARPRRARVPCGRHVVVAVRGGGGSQEPSDPGPGRRPRPGRGCGGTAPCPAPR